VISVYSFGMPSIFVFIGFDEKLRVVGLNLGKLDVNNSLRYLLRKIAGLGSVT